MIVKVDFDYDADYMYCPDQMDLDTLIKQFDDWIYDSSVEHPFWTDESRVAVCYRADAIAYWLNRYILSRSEEKAEVLEEMVREDKAFDCTIVL